MQILFNLQIR